MIIDNKIENTPSGTHFFTKTGDGFQPTTGLESAYTPTPEEKRIRQTIIHDFQLSDVIMRKPRREFNDMTVINRMTADQMSFNTYQPNNGEALEGDEVNSWKSRAMRPIVRNKCISIAAHATSRLIFPKVFAYNDDNDEDSDAGRVMMDLMEWAADQSDYAYNNMVAILTALWSPASIIHTEYLETYRTVKKRTDKGWEKEFVKDEDNCGFTDSVVPVDQLYIENFYEHDIQKQGYLIWRRVQSYDLMKAKYAFKYPNFKYVKPGVQLIYNDANQKFYEVYDMNMRQNLCEEIVYWNKAEDLMVILVNGVVLTDPDNPNPRLDKQYPFIKFGYELLDDGKCFYYKSLAFKLLQDASIINSLYPMIMDGTYLQIFPPMFSVGADTITSDVIVPGAVTTFSDPQSQLNPINTMSQGSLQAGLTALSQVETSINQSSEEPIFSQATGNTQTAYEISKREQERNTVIGMFIQMISQYVRQYGKLRISDIIQFLTLADIDKIINDDELVYRTFLLHNKNSHGKDITRKIRFDANLPSEPISGKEKLDLSYKVLEEQGDDMEIYKVNPELFRKLKYILSITPDVLHPTSEDLDRAYMLEEYDRAIANPLLDQEQVTKDFLLSAYPKSRKDVDKYFPKEKPLEPQDPFKLMNSAQMQTPQPSKVAGQPQPNQFTKNL